jgi:hypothetical protein
MDKNSRKALKREYLETQHPMGIFRVYNKIEEKSLIGTSVNLPAALNGQLARLKFGGHPSAALQADWHRLGADAFEFEILDTLTPPETPGYDPTEDLRVLEALWLDRLQPFDEKGYNKRPKQA